MEVRFQRIPELKSKICDNNYSNKKNAPSVLAEFNFQLLVKCEICKVQCTEIPTVYIYTLLGPWPWFSTIPFPIPVQSELVERCR